MPDSVPAPAGEAPDVKALLANLKGRALRLQSEVTLSAIPTNGEAHFAQAGRANGIYEAVREIEVALGASGAPGRDAPERFFVVVDGEQFECIPNVAVSAQIMALANKDFAALQLFLDEPGDTPDRLVFALSDEKTWSTTITLRPGVPMHFYTMPRPLAGASRGLPAPRVEVEGGYKCPACGRQSLYRDISALCKNPDCDYAEGGLPAAPPEEPMSVAQLAPAIQELRKIRDELGRVSADAPSPESQPYFDYDEVHGAGSVSRGVPEPSRDKMRAVLNWARDIETLLAAIFSESDDDRPAADTKVLYDGLADVRRELKAAVAAVDFGGSPTPEMAAFDRAEFDELLREVVALREWKAAHEAAAFGGSPAGASPPSEYAEILRLKKALAAAVSALKAGEPWHYSGCAGCAEIESALTGGLPRPSEESK